MSTSFWSCCQVRHADGPFESTACSYFRVTEPLEVFSWLTQTVVDANHRERSECTQHRPAHGMETSSGWRTVEAAMLQHGARPRWWWSVSSGGLSQLGSIRHWWFFMQLRVLCGNWDLLVLHLPRKCIYWWSKNNTNFICIIYDAVVLAKFAGKLCLTVIACTYMARVQVKIGKV